MLDKAVAQLQHGQALTVAEAQASIEALMSGTVPDAQITAFLLAMNEKEPTVDEVVGGARALRAHMVPFPVSAKDQQHAVDTCGTGGDGTGTINISTIAAFIVAAAGAPVIKHGNRSASSQCGSADVLEALGIQAMTTPEQAAECFKRTNLTFLFAPAFHPAMKHVGPVRTALGVRTIFNLLGPLASPAGVGRQVVGVSRSAHTLLVGEALQHLDAEHAVVVHGADGLDEFTIADTNTVVEVRRGVDTLESTLFDAEVALGMHRVPTASLVGGNAAMNAEYARHMLKRHADDALQARREVVLLNAAWALRVSGQYSDNIAQCYDVSRLAVETGAAAKKLSEVQQCLPR